MMMKEGSNGSDNWSKTKDLLETQRIVGIGSDEHTNGSGLFQRTRPGDIVLLRSNGKQFLLEAVGLPAPLDRAIFDLDPQFSFFESYLPVKLLAFENAFIDCRGYIPTFSSIDSPELTEWYNRTKSKIAMQTIRESLIQNKQIVLTGPPGTGKTYLARELAANLLECEDQKHLVGRHPHQFGFVQFHPAYDYTDFVEGLKPVSEENGHIGFRLKNGIFRSFCETAAKEENNGKKFVFVIDEINRADLSRVFGELFYALEPDYRGVTGAVETQYSSLRKDSEKKFYVPGNIYIIGTMNDIDRSIESMDFALRRRFAWHEVKADEARFEQVMQGVLKGKAHDNARKRYTAINTAIGDTEGLGGSYCIGPAYFRKLKNYSDETSDRIRWEEFWSYHLFPLIREYVRGMANASEIIKTVEDAFFLKNLNG